jgi:hypothetical protein
MSNYFTGHVNHLLPILPPSSTPRPVSFDDFLHTPPNPGTPYNGFFEEPPRSPASATAVAIMPDQPVGKPRVESAAVQGLISALSEMVEAHEAGEVAACASAATAAHDGAEVRQGETADDPTIEELLTEVASDTQRSVRDYGSFQALQGLPGPCVVQQLQRPALQHWPSHSDYEMPSPTPSCSSVQEVDPDATTDEDVEFSIAEDAAEEEGDFEMEDLCSTGSVSDDFDYLPSGRPLDFQRGKGKGKNKNRYGRRLPKSRSICMPRPRRKQNGLVSNIRSFYDPSYDFAFEYQAPGSPEQESQLDTIFESKLQKSKVPSHFTRK